MNMTNINLTPILQALIGLLAALITYKLVPWLREKTTREQAERYAAAVRVAVFAAEQIFGAGHGAEKMDYAIRYLRDKGFEVDSREIEGAVGQFINALNWDFGAETVEKDEETEKTEE